jgi:hypothetical protein
MFLLKKKQIQKTKFICFFLSFCFFYENLIQLILFNSINRTLLDNKKEIIIIIKKILNTGMENYTESLKILFSERIILIEEWPEKNMVRIIMKSCEEGETHFENVHEIMRVFSSIGKYVHLSFQ